MVGPKDLSRSQTRDFLGDTFHGNFYLLSELLAEVCGEEEAEEIFFHISFC